MGSNPSFSADNTLPLTLTSTLVINPWFIANAPSLFPKIPAEIFLKIASYLQNSKFHPNRLNKAVLFSLSLTCRFFRDFFRNSVYSAITITSPESLTELTEYLSTHAWPGKSTAIKFLALRWHQEIRLPGDQLLTILAAPSVRCISSQKITLNIRLLLETHTASLEELTLDFPGAGLHFQTAILYSQGIFAHEHLRLKHLHISNGLCPQSKPAAFLLCSVSALCAYSLEELVIDGSCSISKDACKSARGLFPDEIHVPGVRMFRQFEKLRKLWGLHVKNLAGFNERCLDWMLSGEQMQSPSRLGRKKVLTLVSNPNLTNVEINRALESVEGGFEEIVITITQKEEVLEPLPRKSLAASPATWLTLDDEKAAEVTEATGNSIAFSSVCDTDLFTDALEGITTESLITHEEDYHQDTSLAVNTPRDSYGSIDHPSYYYHHQANHSYQFVNLTQSRSELGFYNVTHSACRNLRRLNICAHTTYCNSLSNTSLNYHYHKNNITTSYSPLSVRSLIKSLEDTEENYINRNPFFQTSSSPPFKLNPVISAPSTSPTSLHLGHTDSISKSPEPESRYKNLQVNSRRFPVSKPSSSSRVRRGRVTKLRSGGREAKGLPSFADKTLERGTLEGFLGYRRCKNRRDAGEADVGGMGGGGVIEK